MANVASLLSSSSSSQTLLLAGDDVVDLVVGGGNDSRTDSTLIRLFDGSPLTPLTPLFPRFPLDSDSVVVVVVVPDAGVMVVGAIERAIFLSFDRNLFNFGLSAFCCWAGLLGVLECLSGLLIGPFYSKTLARGVASWG